MTREWTSYHHLTSLRCVSHFDGQLLTTEIAEDEQAFDNVHDQLLWAASLEDTLADLDQAGLLRTCVASAEHAAHELRLVAEVLRETAP